jgi:hypothetical protein
VTFALTRVRKIRALNHCAHFQRAVCDEAYVRDAPDEVKAAMCATVCGEWSRASDLWFEVSYIDTWRSVAVVCGAEAALHAGFLDLAEYFYIHLHDPLPDRAEKLRKASVQVKEARTAYYQRCIEAGHQVALPPRELIGLRMHRLAINALIKSDLYRDNFSKCARLLLKSYEALGANRAALEVLHRLPNNDEELNQHARRLRKLVKKSSEPIERNIRRFVERHAAAKLVPKTFKLS